MSVTEEFFQDNSKFKHDDHVLHSISSLNLKWNLF